MSRPRLSQEAGRERQNSWGFHGSWDSTRPNFHLALDQKLPKIGKMPGYGDQFRGSMAGKSVWKLSSSMDVPENSQTTFSYMLIGGFNPPEKYESQIGSSSQLLGKITNVYKCSKPPTSMACLARKIHEKMVDISSSTRLTQLLGWRPFLWSTWRWGFFRTGGRTAFT